MIETFNELIAFLKNPVLEKDANQNSTYRLKKFLHILIISILTGAALSPLFVLIEHLGWVDMSNHAMERLIKSFSKLQIFLFAVIVAPLLEESIFRAPITLFRGEKVFKIAFYVFAVAFGLIHLSNFPITNNVLILAPILVAPQIILGGYLGFIRVRFGLIWSILLHATYNAFFVFISFAGDSI
ncbi:MULTISPECIES: CPBP family intramembrane glutamic endopeptidase [unclassified Tenacibaculum]|uniref:CPBP family intramembrane glutamic endopeptidase n=1 Tax=unclassified Tenacibaculum TaxID=2635139 RepID=UPI001F38F120|nr:MULTISPECIES: CPBP family intramembrane glutamic endopeptidase [unclassified Tenacibaculum]MCF2874355.1 CPBP family intramembrane metalloprotease [Tenacibaculum sp. Cn5-1]MCF2934936.1 CPBP family intramembrane metalloprotease [Tenacibaculum sp. Cn5-34]MCG7511146.1 CPBP family intramembrane metalloprotease [Tenacibaculum sp. Cn5-46]